MKTSKEKAKEAREQAREIITDRGFNYNEVSVRKRSGSLSSKIKIEIKKRGDQKELV